MLVYITDHTDWWSFSNLIWIWSPKFCSIKPDMVQELWILKEKTGKTSDISLGLPVHRCDTSHVPPTDHKNIETDTSMGTN